MTVRAVLLDLDGTLVDQESAVAAALAGWLPEIGVAPTPEIVARWRDVQERHLAGWRERRVTFPEQRRARLREFLPAVGVACPPGEAAQDQIFDQYLSWYERSWRRFDDVDPMLDALRAAGLPTAVLTNGTDEQQASKLERTGLAGRVGPVLTAEALGAAKPSAEAFRRACARLDWTPSEVVNVGDRPDLDVAAARAAGLHAVLVDRSGATPGALATLRDLVPYLRSYTIKS